MQLGEIERQVADTMARHHIPGVSLVVASGTSIQERCFGLADLATQRPVVPTSRFGVGSLTKSVTSLALLILESDGKLSLDAPVSDFVPLSLGVPGHPITLRHLMSNSSGIPDLGLAEIVILGLQGVQRRPLFPLGDFADLYRHMNGAAANVLPPGQRYLYCNEGFAVLADVIARVSEVTYPEFCRARIFEPLALGSCGFDPDTPDVVTGYWEKDGQLIPSPQLSGELIAGPGGLIATAADLVTCARVFAGRAPKGWSTVHTEAAVQVHIQPPTGTREGFGEEAGGGGYGYGWRIWEDFLGQRVLHHGGSTGVSGTQVFLVPEQDLAVALLANRDPFPYAEAVSILALCLGADPREALPCMILRRTRERLVGTYRAAGGQSRQIAIEGGLLRMSAGDEPHRFLVPLQNAPDCLEFGVLDDRGGCTPVTFLHEGHQTVFYQERYRFTRQP